MVGALGQHHVHPAVREKLAGHNRAIVDEVQSAVAAHDVVFLVEQNRDAQMRSMLINELEIDPAKLVKVLHYDGTPITARFIGVAIRKILVPAEAAAPQREVA